MSTNTYAELTTTFQYSMDTYCKYPGCEEVRVLKVTGELHNFCKYHREKASENQRRYAQNKRERKRQKRLAQSSVMTNIYQEKFIYANTMPHYSAVPMGYPNYMPDPTSIDFTEGLHGPLYSEQLLEDDIFWLADLLGCPQAEEIQTHTQMLL